MSNDLAVITSLGDGNVFVKKTDGGQIRSVKGRMALSEKQGEIAVIQDKGMVTAKGFNKLNQIAGLSIVTPEKLTLPEGHTVVNPYPIIDPESGTISKVWVKKLAIGFSPIGNLVITSATLLYDVNMYFIQDLTNKVKYNKDAGRVCMEAMLTEEEKRSGGFYKIQGPLGVYVDFTHKEILKAVDTFINKKQFAERNAQTICERLVMSKHPALAYPYVEVGGPDKNRVAAVTVVGYVNEFDRKQLLDIAAQAERGEEVKINGQRAEIIETTAEATSEDMIIDQEEDEFSIPPDQHQGDLFSRPVPAGEGEVKF